MARRIPRPKVTSFLDFALSTKRKYTFMEELPVSNDSCLANLTLKDSGIRQRYNLIVIAIEKATGEMLFNPSFEALIAAGDTLIVVGEEPNLHALGKDFDPIGIAVPGAMAVHNFFGHLAADSGSQRRYRERLKSCK